MLVALAGGMRAATGSGASAPKFDARWSALQTCWNNTEHGSLSNSIHPNGFVATTSPGHLQVEGQGGFAAAIVYEGTLTQAKADAKRTKEYLHPAIPPGRSAGFAIGTSCSTSRPCRPPSKRRWSQAASPRRIQRSPRGASRLAVVRTPKGLRVAGGARADGTSREHLAPVDIPRWIRQGAVESG